MIWLNTFLFFMANSVVFTAGFVVYAIILSLAGKSGKVVKVFGGFLAYLIFAALLVSPLFWDASVVIEFRKSVKSDDIYFFYFFVCYALSIIPGALLFKRKYLAGLKRLGYFEKRGLR